MESPPLHRPIPRRPFELPSDTSDLPEPNSPQSGPAYETLSPTEPAGAPPKRTKSTLALTASTLFGIYSPNYGDETTSNTPFQLSRNPSTANLDTLASMPALRPLRTREEEAARALELRHPVKPTLPQLLLRLGSLFVFGVAYGLIVTHLYDRIPISSKNLMEQWSVRYLAFWGLAGVGLGSLLPWLDGEEAGMGVESGTEEGNGGWSPAVRSIGAFIGIAYAIRKLPWQSTLQLSAALALVNPFLWFTIDRTRSGFWFATLVGIAGTAFLLQISPNMIQTPASAHAGHASNPELLFGLVSLDTVAVMTWIASVLFCSCVCFGNIGRRLARGEKKVVV